MSFFGTTVTGTSSTAQWRFDLMWASTPGFVSAWPHGSRVMTDHIHDWWLPREQDLFADMLAYGVRGSAAATSRVFMRVVNTSIWLTSQARARRGRLCCSRVTACSDSSKAKRRRRTRPTRCGSGQAGLSGARCLTRSWWLVHTDCHRAEPRSFQDKVLCESRPPGATSAKAKRCASFLPLLEAAVAARWSTEDGAGRLILWFEPE